MAPVIVKESVNKHIYGALRSQATVSHPLDVQDTYNPMPDQKPKSNAPSENETRIRERISAQKSLLLGTAVGDALGVPVEFHDRESLRKNPVTGIRGYGSHNQPPGTFSDDTSLTLCLAESLTRGFDLQDQGRLFVKWLKDDYWTARGELFDIGISTDRALTVISRGVPPEQAGVTEENANGNGSLMRISPLLFHLLDKPAEERFHLTRLTSGVTHAHIRSVVGCYYYLDYLKALYDGHTPAQAHEQLCESMPEKLTKFGAEPDEIRIYDRLFSNKFGTLPEPEIHSSGYVVHTLEASVWCLLTTSSYPEAVLKAVNLGDDTDTTGAVTGAMAGLYYGMSAIPEEWLAVLAKRDEIESLAEKVWG